MKSCVKLPDGTVRSVVDRNRFPLFSTANPLVQKENPTGPFLPEVAEVIAAVKGITMAVIVLRDTGSNAYAFLHS